MGPCEKDIQCTNPENPGTIFTISTTQVYVSKTPLLGRPHKTKHAVNTTPKILQSPDSDGGYQYL